MYTQAQLDIEILKNNENHIFKILERLEQKVDSHFHWTLGLTLGMYVVIISALSGVVGHSFGWI